MNVPNSEKNGRQKRINGNFKGRLFAWVKRVNFSMSSIGESTTNDCRVNYQLLAVMPLK